MSSKPSWSDEREPPPTPEWTHEQLPLEVPICTLSYQYRVGSVDSYTATESFRERHALGFELLTILIGIWPSVERLSIQQTMVDYDTPYLSELRPMPAAKGARLLT